MKRSELKNIIKKCIIEEGLDQLGANSVKDALLNRSDYILFGWKAFDASEQFIDGYKVGNQFLDVTGISKTAAVELTKGELKPLMKKFLADIGAIFINKPEVINDKAAYVKLRGASTDDIKKALADGDVLEAFINNFIEDAESKYIGKNTKSNEVLNPEKFVSAWANFIDGETITDSNGNTWEAEAEDDEVNFYNDSTDDQVGAPIYTDGTPIMVLSLFKANDNHNEDEASRKDVDISKVKLEDPRNPKRFGNSLLRIVKRYLNNL
jgi:hypothetical protein